MSQNDPIASLISLLSRLPGIGKRTAARLAFHVLEGDAQYAEALGRALGTIHDEVTQCERCGNYGAESRCTICQDPRRDGSVICVVAKVPDLIALEALGTFRGRYHVLHGAISPVDGIGPERLRIRDLVDRISQRDAAGERYEEIVMATNPTLEGEATAMYIAERIADRVGVVSRIARGIPVGGDLEYADEVTLVRAMQDRHQVQHSGHS